MKKTIKVSIGGMQFNLEEEAFRILDEYLNRLQQHYAHKAEGKEIVADVEARIAELLQMKLMLPEAVVTEDEALNIIEIMGKPEEYDGDSDTAASQSEAKDPAFAPLYKKRLYRDTQNCILGGVCSGLAYFFKIDPVIVRVLFAVLAFCSSWFSGLGAVICIYILLWIITPKAKTFDQKLQMIGKDPSLDGVLSGEGSMLHAQRSANNGARTIRVILCIFFIIIGVGFLFPAAFLGISSWFNVPFQLNDMFAIFAGDTIALKLASYLLLLLPSIAFIYLGIRILKRVKQWDVVFLIILFSAWICAIIFVASFAFKTSHHYSYNASASQRIELPAANDTLYVALSPSYWDAENVFWHSNFYRLATDSGNCYYAVPRVSVATDSALQNIEIEVKKKAYARNSTLAAHIAEEMALSYYQPDSAHLYFSPPLYSRKRVYDRQRYSLLIRCPENKTVIVDKIFK